LNGQKGETLAAASVTMPSTESLSQLFAEHHRRVLIAAYRITGSMATAEDVTQAVFLRMASVQRPMGNVGRYLYRAADKSMRQDEALLRTASDTLRATEPDAAQLAAFTKRVGDRLGLDVASHAVIDNIDFCGQTGPVVFRSRCNSQFDFRLTTRLTRLRLTKKLLTTKLPLSVHKRTLTTTAEMFGSEHKFSILIDRPVATHPS